MVETTMGLRAGPRAAEARRAAPSRISQAAKALVALAFTLFVCSAQAATLEGATLPDRYTVDGQVLALNGIGLRTLTIFHIRAYVAGLYLAHLSHDAAQILASPGPKVIMLQFLRNASKEQVEKQYREGQRNNCGDGGCAPSDQSDFERLVAAAPGVSTGDRSIYVFTKNRVKVFANDRLIGDFANPDLSYHLLDGFIGAHPPSEALRSHLLGLPDD